jgi:hypothetical protein
MWGGRFASGPDAIMEAINASIAFDRRLYARIEAEHQEPFWVRGWRKLFQSGQPGAWRPALSMSLAGVAVIGLLLVKMPNTPDVRPEQAPSVKTAVIDKQDVEGLDTALEDMEMLRALDSNSNAL